MTTYSTGAWWDKMRRRRVFKSRFHLPFFALPWSEFIFLPLLLSWVIALLQVGWLVVGGLLYLVVSLDRIYSLFSNSCAAAKGNFENSNHHY